MQSETPALADALMWLSAIRPSKIGILLVLALLLGCLSGAAGADEPLRDTPPIEAQSAIQPVGEPLNLAPVVFRIPHRRSPGAALIGSGSFAVVMGALLIATSSPFVNLKGQNVSLDPYFGPILGSGILHVLIGGGLIIGGVYKNSHPDPLAVNELTLTRPELERRIYKTKWLSIAGGAMLGAGSALLIAAIPGFAQVRTSTPFPGCYNAIYSECHAELYSYSLTAGLAILGGTFVLVGAPLFGFSFSAYRTYQSAANGTNLPAGHATAAASPAVQILPYFSTDGGGLKLSGQF